MIVVDTSVWIGHFRDDATPAVARLRAIPHASDIIVGDLVMLECLQGARDEAHAVRMEQALRTFRVAAMVDDALASEGARRYRTLRALGVTPRKTIDVMIATYALVNDFALLHQDRDFDPWAQHFGLRFG